MDETVAQSLRVDIPLWQDCESLFLPRTYQDNEIVLVYVDELGKINYIQHQNHCPESCGGLNSSAKVSMRKNVYEKK